MSLASRLDFLLRLFDTNMSKLARAANVDPSLISKWKSGIRRFAPDSHHLIAIAQYFTGSEIFSASRDLLIKEFRKVNLTCDSLDTKKAFEKALIQYLCVPNITEEKTACNKEIQPYELVGCEASFEIFHGIDGKRKAVIKFLKRVLDCSKPIELFLFSQEEMSWLTCDKEFFVQWANLLSEVVKKGNRIKIIHNVNRNPSEILKVIEQWLPLHLTGKIEAWFLPKYSPLALKTTLFAAKGVAAIMAVATYDKSEAEYNFYYTNKEIVNLAEGIFYSYIHQSQKLFNVFSAPDNTDYCDSVFEIEKQSEDSISFCSYISTSTMPFQIYERIVKAMDLESEKKDKRIEIQKRRIDIFKNNLQLHKHIEIEFIEPLNVTNSSYKCLDFMCNEYIYLSKEEYIMHLKNLLNYIKGFELFEYIILDKPLIEKFSGIHFYLKHEKGMIISSDNNPVAITFTESTVVHAFDNYLMTLVDSIPYVIRRKERNINVLKKRIERLELLQ